jgi:hypothetical protein
MFGELTHVIFYDFFNLIFQHWINWELDLVNCLDLISLKLSQSYAVLLNPDRPGGSTRGLDRSGQHKRPVQGKNRPDPGDPD